MVLNEMSKAVTSRVYMWFKNIHSCSVTGGATLILNFKGRTTLVII